MTTNTLQRNGPTIELLALIKRVVLEAGGQVNSITRPEEGKIAIEISGLPEGPLTEKQEEAVRWLESVGIKCR